MDPTNGNSPLVVRARGLVKEFAGRRAVDGIDFDIRPGEIVGFLGPNGAGKTTTIRMLLNILTPTAGELEIFGLHFARHRSQILRQMNASSGSLSLPGKLTAIENLQVFADLYCVPHPDRRIAELVARFDLQKLLKKSLYSLSTGQQVRVALAKAFLNRPRLLLLDEPTASLDPDVADRIRGILMTAVREEGTTVFLTSHNMAEVEQVCTRVLFLSEGKIKAEGTPQELAQRIRRWTIAIRTRDGRSLREELDRDHVGPYVTDLVRQGAEIASISVEEPSLEDFFVHSARQVTGDE